MNRVTIRKAIIPIAGKGSRLIPLTSVLPKALFPVVCYDKEVRSIIHVLLNELRQAGIDNVCIIVSPGQEDVVRQYLSAARRSCRVSLSSQISFVEQREPKGFGDALLQAKGFVGEEPFVLLLGDHVRVGTVETLSCIRQVLQAFDHMEGKAMVGVHGVDEAVIHTMGVATGVLIEERVFRCTEFVEKPDKEIARRRLRTEGLPEGRYLAHCGIYIFDPEIFGCLQEEESQVEESGKELELAAAQVRLLQRYPESYYLYRIEGKAYDMGNPEGYLRAFTAIGEMDSERL